MRKKQHLIWILISLGILLPGCVSKALPTPKSSESCILVIQHTMETEWNREVFCDYRLCFKDSTDYLLVNADKKLNIYKQLKPGVYNFSRLVSYYRKYETPASQSKINIRFTLKPGKITILPYRINTKIIADNNLGRYSQAWSVSNLLASDIEKIKAEIRADYKNADMWEFAD